MNDLYEAGFDAGGGKGGRKPAKKRVRFLEIPTDMAGTYLSEVARKGKLQYDMRSKEFRPEMSKCWWDEVTRSR